MPAVEFQKCLESLTKKVSDIHIYTLAVNYKVYKATNLRTTVIYKLLIFLLTLFLIDKNLNLTYHIKTIAVAFLQAE